VDPGAPGSGTPGPGTPGDPLGGALDPAAPGGDPADPPDGTGVASAGGSLNGGCQVASSRLPLGAAGGDAATLLAAFALLGWLVRAGRARRVAGR
jgi:hypothetical protein